jgi:cobalamin transport system permease protein
LNNRSNNIYLFVILTVILIIFFVLDIAFGSVNIPFEIIFNELLAKSTENQYSVIIREFRLPRAITAVLVGSALSVSGLQMQTFFRNPLAGPYILGISSGASLGVAILVMGFSSFFVASSNIIMSSWSLIIAAWMGAGILLFCIMIISARVKDIMTILILGILFASATTAIVSILQYFSNASLLKAFVIWSFGSLSNVTLDQLQILTPSIVIGLLIAIFSFKLLNALLLGEDYAKSIGLPVKTSRYIIFISTSILAGSVTAFCGPIGFIGIAAPHIARLIFKNSDHRIVIPASILVGSILILFSDIIAQLPGLEQTLPINSVTAIIGIPVVIWLVIRNQKLVSTN